MRLKLYQIDAFAERLFEGNPAAICPLDEWLPDELMQSIAAENNLAETAFFVETPSGYSIRWFTPTTEVDLCGHATLAAAYVIFNELGYKADEIHFDSRSGTLTVTCHGELLELDFPAQPIELCEPPAAILDAFSERPIAYGRSEDHIVIFENESAIIDANPNLMKLRELDLRGVAITARSSEYDFVTRFFAPNYGVDEDSVTGSAYTQLTPYWAKQLGKTTLRARQRSKRGGDLVCTVAGDRIRIAGSAVKYMEGTIKLPQL